MTFFLQRPVFAARLLPLYYGGNESLFAFTPPADMTINVVYSGRDLDADFRLQRLPSSGGTPVSGVSSSTSSKNVSAGPDRGNTYHIPDRYLSDSGQPLPGQRVNYGVCPTSYMTTVPLLR